MSKLHLDFETRSRVDLKKVGLWRYAMDPSTDVLCLGLGGEGGTTVLRPDDIKRLAGTDAGIWTRPDTLLCAHNAAFEYAIYNLILHRRYGWPALWDPSKWRCTMARAYACGLPGDLDSLGRVLRIKTPKDLDGRKVMLRLCKPLPSGEFDETPETLARLYAYCAVDVQAETEIDQLLPELSESEQRVWEHTLKVNRRGIAVDATLAAKAAQTSDFVVNALNEQLSTLTGGAVDKATQVKSMAYYLNEVHGVPVASLDKQHVTDLINDPLLPEVARDVLAIRRQVGKKNSIAKYGAALTMLCPDGRVRGLLEYHGAHTGRYAGRGLQPQNFTKGWDKPAQQLEAINAILTLTPEQFFAKYGAAAMDTLSDTLRGLFVAGPGKTLVCADFNAIEARVLFWLAGAESALAAYRRGESPYLDMAETIYNRKGLSKHGTPVEYDLGKRTILGCGFQMSWEKFRDSVYIETAKKGKPLILSDALSQRAVRAYRDKYPEVVQLWYEVERAAINAVLDSGGRAFPCAGGKVLWGMTKDRRFLACRLPSGRYLRYYHPTVREAWVTFCKDKACPHFAALDPAVCPERQKRPRLFYEAVSPWTNQWSLVPTYGGALVENITQAVARDLLVHGMLAVEDAGYPVNLTVHDEVVGETQLAVFESDTREAAGTRDKEILADFIAIMCKTPDWAKGCPVAAEGWVGPRYHK